MKVIKNYLLLGIALKRFRAGNQADLLQQGKTE
jgi:hypothetical protein